MCADNECRWVWRTIETKVNCPSAITMSRLCFHSIRQDRLPPTATKMQNAMHIRETNNRWYVLARPPAMRSINQPRKSHRAQSNYCIFRGAPKDVHRKRAINTYHFPHSLVISCTTSDNNIRSRCLLVWRAHASMKHKSFPHIACWHSETQKSQKTAMFKKRRGARILATPGNLMFFKWKSRLSVVSDKMKRAHWGWFC